MKILCKIKHGSFLYGTNTPTSDVDFKGVYLPSFEDVVFGRVKHTIDLSTNKSSTKNTSDDVDEQYYSLPHFIDMLCSGETIAIDMIHANKENTMVTSPEWEFLVSNRSDFYTKKMKSFLGYCRKQAAKYGIKGSRIDALNRVKSYLLKKMKNETTRLDDNMNIEIGLEGVASSISMLSHQSNDGSYSKEELDILYDNSTKYVEVVNGIEKKGKFIDKKFLMICGSMYEFTMRISDVIKSIDAKLNKYGERAHKAKDNVGVDWKALHHALRAGFQLQEIYETGDLKYPLKDAKYLTSVKNGEYSFNEVQKELCKVIDSVAISSSKSNNPEEVNRTKFDAWVLSLYKDMVNEL